MRPNGSWHTTLYFFMRLSDAVWRVQGQSKTNSHAVRSGANLIFSPRRAGPLMVKFKFPENALDFQIFPHLPRQVLNFNALWRMIWYYSRGSLLVMLIFSANYKKKKKKYEAKHERPEVSRPFSASAGAQWAPKLLIAVVVVPVN